MQGILQHVLAGISYASEINLWKKKKEKKMKKRSIA